LRLGLVGAAKEMNSRWLGCGDGASPVLAYAGRESLVGGGGYGGGLVPGW